MTGITEILAKRIDKNSELIGTNTELIEKLFENIKNNNELIKKLDGRVIELETHIFLLTAMTVQKELRKSGLSRRKAQIIKHTVGRYLREVSETLIKKLMEGGYGERHNRDTI